MFKTILLTSLALLAFAGNSVLNRMALNSDAGQIIDAASFTSIRLISGVLFLLLIIALSAIKNSTSTKTGAQGLHLNKGSWLSAFYLFVYALAFSYAYITLETGPGALILFGIVQVTMIVSHCLKGRKLHYLEWLGLSIAFIGLAILLLPGASAPSIIGFMLMTLSGIAWGLYTLAGKGSSTPLIDTTNNFIRTLPFVAILLILTYKNAHVTTQGMLLAVTSGAITSGLGYAIWYSALKGLNVTQAAVIQLTVPIIAAIGGVLFSNEIISLQLIISSILVLGGVLIVIIGKQIMHTLQMRSM